jgi:translation initiation factor 2A
MDLATVSKDEIRVYRSPRWDAPIFSTASSAINGEGMIWSQDGSLLGALNAEGGVSVYDAQSEFRIIYEAKKQFNSIRHFYFSPQNQFLVTFERFSSKDDKDNVFCHNLKTGAINLQIKIKSLTERNWPAFTWSNDERICLHMTTNTVKVMHGRNLSLQSPLYSLTMPNISLFSLSPSGLLLAGFFPEAKGQPASLRVYDITDRSARPRASKATFNAQNAKILWNKSSTALIAIFSTDSDATSSSYYGTSSLFFMRLSDQGDMISSSLVTGESGGPCHDACWSPTADEFIAVTGKMPAEIALYDGKTGSKRISFGVTRRNTLKWNEFGRVFVAGGFGNLPGDIDVWDKNKALCLSTVSIPCTVICEWGPDGRHFVSASTFPRMRVDNFVQVVNYDGTVVAKLTDFSELYACKWRPSQAENGLFEDTPPSPRVVQNAKKPAAAGDLPPEPKKQAYRPPGGSGALAEQMRKEREIENQKKAIKVKVEREPTVPGMAPGGPSASALRNARKKKAAAQKKGESGANSEAEETEQTKKAPPAPLETSALNEEAKKLRGLQKKLREITQLKESGKELSEAQRAKVESEPLILAEIAELQRQG